MAASTKMAARTPDPVGRQGAEGDVDTGQPTELGQCGPPLHGLRAAIEPPLGQEGQVAGPGGSGGRIEQLVGKQGQVPRPEGQAQVSGAEMAAQVLDQPLVIGEVHDLLVRMGVS